MTMEDDTRYPGISRALVMFEDEPDDTKAGVCVELADLRALSTKLAELEAAYLAAEELAEAMSSIETYGADTLSGRTDGPDDRQWQREAVAEMRVRAEAALTAYRKATRVEG